MANSGALSLMSRIVMATYPLPICAGFSIKRKGKRKRKRKRKRENQTKTKKIGFNGKNQWEERSRNNLP